MKNIRMLLGWAILLVGSFGWANGSPVGDWLTVDDHTKEKRAIVRLYLKKGILFGKILRVYPKPGDTGICQHCPKPFTNQAIQGLEFIWHLENKGQGVWDGGYILDANNGKIYRAKLRVDGDNLFIRGYIGLSLLGRTQLWTREGHVRSRNTEKSG